MELWKKYSTVFEEYGLDTPLRKAHFMAQIHHESNLVSKSENLNYTAKRLVQVFPKYFKSLQDALPFYGKPKDIANRVYCNRMGNGKENTGDGWNYRGRGYIQLTGKKNYQSLSDYTGIDFINHPDDLLLEPNAIIAALWFWKVNGINKYADADDIQGVTKKINGGLNGIVSRTELLEKYKEVFKE